MGYPPVSLRQVLCASLASRKLPADIQHVLTAAVCSCQEKVRDEPLTLLKAPMLWIRGDKDPFCTDTVFEKVHARMSSLDVKVYMKNCLPAAGQDICICPGS